MPAELEATVLANHVVAPIGFWNLSAAHWTKTDSINAILIFQIFFAWSAAAMPFLFALEAHPGAALRALQGLLAEPSLPHHPFAALSGTKPFQNVIFQDLLSSEVFDFSDDFWLLAEQVKKLRGRYLWMAPFLHARETCKFSLIDLKCEVIFSTIATESVTTFETEIRVVFEADLALHIFINLQLEITILHFYNLFIFN